MSNAYESSSISTFLKGTSKRELVKSVFVSEFPEFTGIRI